MRKTALVFMVLLCSAAAFAAENPYEVSDLLNMAKRSGSLQEKFYREAFLNPDADEGNYGLDVKHYLIRYYGLTNIGFFIPRLILDGHGSSIDQFPVMTPGGAYSCSLLQGFVSFKIAFSPLLVSDKKEDLLSLEFNFLGNYTGIAHRFAITGNSSMSNTSGTETIGTELYDNLYGLTAKTPWLDAHFGIIQNRIVTNLHLTSEGTNETQRYFFGGSLFKAVNADFRVYSNTLEYFDLAVNGKTVMDWLEVKLPFYLNPIIGLVDYNYFYDIADGIRGLASGDFRLYLNPQIGYNPYVMATSYIEWQPNNGSLNVSPIRCADATVRLLLPMYIYLSGEYPVSIVEDSNTNRPLIGLISIGINGSLSYYSDSALPVYGAPSTSTIGYQVGYNLHIAWMSFNLIMERRFSMNHQQNLRQYIESYNKPVQEFYILWEL